MAVKLSKQAKIALGAVLLGVGVGGGIYLYQRYQKQKGVTNSVGTPNLVASPAVVSASGGAQSISADVTWTNTATGSLLYVAQAAILEEWSGQGGIIAGHLWASPSDAEQAEAAANTGNLAEAAADAAQPSWRLLSQQVAPQSQGSLTFSGSIDPGAIVQPFAIVAWIAPGGPTSKLIVPDPVGTRVSLTTAGAYTVIRPVGTD